MSLHNLDRPTDHAALLGAVVDQFVGRPAHPVGDVRQFEQLALGLIDIVDCEAAARILRPLALHPETPQSIFDRLLTKGGACAALALQFAPTLARTELMAAARGADPALARAAARRSDLGRDIVEALLQRGEAGTLRALAANSTLRLELAARRVLAEAARDDLALARLLLDRDDFVGEAECLFLAATRPERAEIILNACRRALQAGRIEPTLAESALVTQLEAAARRGDRVAAEGILAAALGCRPERAAALLADPRGEPMALALAALGVDADAAARILLSAAWAFADDTGRARPLSALVRAVPQRAAMEIVAAITGGGRERETAARIGAREAPIAGPAGVVRRWSPARPRNRSAS